MSEYNNNNSFSLVTISVMAIIIIIIIIIYICPLILLSFPSLLYHNTTSTLATVYGQSSNDSSLLAIIHGGGTGSITCPDGSSKQAVISFVVSENQY